MTQNKTVHISVYCALSMAWRARFSEMQIHLPGVLSGSDSEDLHRFRIALRQTRALLKIARDAIPDLDKFAAEFKWLAAATGPVRDSDIQLQYGRDFRGENATATADCAGLEPILDQLETERAQQQLQLTKDVSSARCRKLLSSWQQFISTPPALNTDKMLHTELTLAAHTPVTPWAMVTIIRRCRQLLQRGILVDAKTPATALHQLRIRCKRLRYVLESLAPFFKKQQFELLLGKLVTLQKILGVHQDTITAAARWRELIMHFSTHHQTTAVASVALLLNWLDDAERQQREARAQFPGALLAFAKACEF